MITMSTLGKNGALGNQLFQYAALYGISKKTNFKMIIPAFDNNVTGELNYNEGDFDDWRLHEDYEYALGCFEITSDQYHFTNDELPLIEKIKNKLINNETKGQFIYKYESPFFHFDSRVFNIKNKTDLEGYFQSEKYFEHCSNAIREEFRVKKVFQSDAKQNMVLYRNDNNTFVSIHVRRKGQRKGELWEEIHGIPSKTYYQNAMKYMMGKFDNLRFLVFSDDIEWCKNNISHPNLCFVEGNSAIIDFTMMSMCDHNIIGNSSFSWWSAWLNDNQKKIVISPKNWFKKEYEKKKNIITSDLIPKSWIRL